MDRRFLRRALIAVLAVMTVGAAGCSTSTGPRERTAVYPERQSWPAWSAKGQIVYDDAGIRCVLNDGGGALVDPDSAGIFVFDPASGERRRIAPTGITPAWDPSAAVIAIGSRSTLVLLDTAGVLV